MARKPQTEAKVVTLATLDGGTKPLEAQAPKITPAVQFGGPDADKKHALQKVFDGAEADMPIVKSVGMMGVPGTNTYFSFVMKTQGRKVLEIIPDQPNLRLIAKDSGITTFVQEILDPSEI